MPMLCTFPNPESHHKFTMRLMFLFSKSSQQHQHRRNYNLNHLRTLFEGTFKPVRDRGLDHAVEREKNLKPLINLKNLIKLEPSKSLPISIISQNRESLQLPFRPIEFTRRYPSLFHEFLPAGIAAASSGVRPHVRLTPEALALDADEQLMYQSDGYKEQLANRILKLLMISRIHKIPLRIIECLKWDLGLPNDYVQSLIPEFPDYFRVVQGKGRGFGNDDDRVLELVCWSNELAVSVMEKKGKEFVFPVQFSTGFEMDKRYERWLSQWQKLPYVSPYENAAHLSASSDESDRWLVGVLHEILHVLVPKKTEKDNVLMLGEWLGLRPRFKRAMLQHPGIFYLSNKIGTQTVVLREGYKRGSLVEHHPLMNLRSQYIHLMNTVKEDSKDSKVVQAKSNPKESNAKDLEGSGRGEDDENSEEEHEGERNESYEAEIDDASEDDFDDDEEQPSQRGNHKTGPNSRGREVGKGKSLRVSRRERSTGKSTQKTREKNPSRVSKRIQVRGGNRDVESSVQRSSSSKSRGRLSPGKNIPVYGN